MLTPPGYIKVTPNDIFIQILDGVVTRYDKSAGDATSQVIPATVTVVTPEVNVVEGISYTQSGDTASFTVGNISGEELPSTGGPGTRGWTFFGILLMALAAAGALVRGRRLV